MNTTVEPDNKGVTNESYDDSEKDVAPPSYEPKAIAADNEDPVTKDKPKLTSDIRPVSSMSAKEIKQEKRRIWKNITVISGSFMCLFTAYNAVANLQSSINSDAGLGTWSQATVYASLIVSSMFVPTLLIKNLKCKWTIVISELCYSAYIGAQFNPSFATLIPCAIVLGLGAAPLWTAQSTYFTKSGNRYAALINEQTSEPSITRFFGFFFMVFQASQVWGNLISSLILSTDTTNKTVINDDILGYCGAHFCTNLNLTNITGSDESGSIIEKPPVDLIQLLTGICMGFAILAAVIVALLVDNTTFEEDEPKDEKSNWEFFIATFKHMKNPYQILIIPLTLWSGFEQAFLTADFTAAFITCSWGVEHVGYVLICYGTVDALASIACGSIVKYVGRLAISVVAAALSLSLIITLLLWSPNPNQPVVYYILAALWGLADAIWHIQLNSFYGFIFKGQEEAGFSNYRLWESLGFTIAFAYSSALCTDAKLYVLLGILFCGMLGYLIIEFRERGKKSNSKEEAKKV